ncbi:MAG TPA: hypothetical protein VM513_03495 [Kofleriaceae bacterium]|jgi:anti-anti-sigma regulatory factor|nr:hypothetical protein [Kofleriaceae bacterium]
MSQKFQSAVQHRGDVSYVKLGGVIDEDNALADLVDKIPTGTAVIDLGDIERINSCGVRDWVTWLSKLENNGTRSVLVECSPAIVAQINLVNNFTGSGVVKSFYVPYFCPECDEEKVLLVEANDMGPAPHEPPTCRCDECDLVMDFDDMPDSYFAFLANQKKLGSIDPSADKINGAVRDLARNAGGDPNRKVRSRASQPNLAGVSNPSVPSLPSIQRSSAGPAAVLNKSSSQPPGRVLGRTSSSPGGSQAPGQMQPMQAQMQTYASGSRPPSHYSQPPMQHNGMGYAPMAPVTAPPRSNTAMFVLIGILIAAVGVLAYIVVAK